MFGSVFRSVRRRARRFWRADEAMKRMRAEGDAARDRGDWTAAAEAYGRYLRRRPDDFRLWVQRGHALKEAGRLDEAEGVYARASRLCPDDADLLLSQGRLAERKGDFAAAAYFHHQSVLADGNIHAVHALLREPVRKHALPLILRPGAPGRRRLVGVVEDLSHGAIMGWAMDTDRPEHAPEIEVLVDDRSVFTGDAALARPDLRPDDAGAAPFGFRVLLTAHADPLAEPEITVRLRRTGEILAGSPRLATLSADVRRRLARRQGAEQALRDAAARLDERADGPMLSIIMPVYDPPSHWLKQALDSVISQWSRRWELICVDDGSTDPGVLALLENYSRRDRRISVLGHDRNRGLSAATNLGLRACTGDYVAFMDQDDVLEPEAVFRLLDAARTGADLIYSDEAVTAEAIDWINHISARPAFSHDYYLSHPYFVHMVCVRRALAIERGGLDETMPISADVDFNLRILERARLIAHTPATLYRWRTHGSSTGHRRREAVTHATLGALTRHLERLGRAAEAHPGPTFNSYRIDYADPGGRTLIVIRGGGDGDALDAALRAIDLTTSPQERDILVLNPRGSDLGEDKGSQGRSGDVTVGRYGDADEAARLIGDAVNKTGVGFVLSMDADVAPYEAGWLARMRAQAGRAEVGAVGATILNPDDTVWHAGLVILSDGAIDHPDAGIPFQSGGVRQTGRDGGLVSTRDYSAVSGAGLMMRAEVFAQVSGFDRDLNDHQDVDLCLKVGSLGYRVLKDAHVLLRRRRSELPRRRSAPEIFRRRWAAFLEAGDPFKALEPDGRAALDQIDPPRIRRGPAGAAEPYPNDGAPEEREAT